MKNIQKLVKFMITEVIEELLEKQEPTIYFDMDGVLADFTGRVDANPSASQAREELEAFMAKKPEIANMHKDDVKTLLKGEQSEPYLKKLKKLYQKHEGLLYKVASEDGHFLELEVMPGVLEMIAAATELTGKKPHILTAPMTRHPRCEEEKIEWVKMHGIDKLTDEFHCTKGKENFAKSEWDILIDDRPKYVNRFRAAGGTAIMHTEASKTIKELEEVIAKLKGMNEVSAIGIGGGALQSSGKVSGTGGTPLGKDMSVEHERMWSGDEPDTQKKGGK